MNTKLTRGENRNRLTPPTDEAKLMEWLRLFREADNRGLVIAENDQGEIMDIGPNLEGLRALAAYDAAQGQPEPKCSDCGGSGTHDGDTPCGLCGGTGREPPEPATEFKAGDRVVGPAGAHGYIVTLQGDYALVRYDGDQTTTRVHLTMLAHEPPAAKPPVEPFELAQMRQTLQEAEARVKELEVHEVQTHTVMTEILGNDDSMEELARALKVRVKELEWDLDVSQEAVRGGIDAVNVMAKQLDRRAADVERAQKQALDAAQAEAAVRKERDALRAQVADRDAAAVACSKAMSEAQEKADRLKVELATATENEMNERRRANVLADAAAGNYWHYQGDGEDYPESLVCPVLMSADQFRALLARDVSCKAQLAAGPVPSVPLDVVEKALTDFYRDGVSSVVDFNVLQKCKATVRAAATGPVPGEWVRKARVDEAIETVRVIADHEVCRGPNAICRQIKELVESKAAIDEAAKKGA